MTREEGERLRAREQIARMRMLLDGLAIAVDDTTVPPGWAEAQAVADAGTRLAATVARIDAYARAARDEPVRHKCPEPCPDHGAGNINETSDWCVYCQRYLIDAQGGEG